MLMTYVVITIIVFLLHCIAYIYMYIYVYICIYIFIAHLRQECNNSKFGIFVLLV